MGGVGSEEVEDRCSRLRSGGETLVMTFLGWGKEIEAEQCAQAHSRYTTASNANRNGCLLGINFS